MRTVTTPADSKPAFCVPFMWRQRLGNESIRDPSRPRLSWNRDGGFAVCGIRFEAFPVEHSLIAPAVGCRVTDGKCCVFYAPDLVRIYASAEALCGIDIYIGDGASITRPILRHRNGMLIGHASIRSQLEWCAEESMRRAIFSHCGSEIVEANAR
jgi:uncharacterized circularly permuted ATP-grasp superfamily protein